MFAKTAAVALATLLPFTLGQISDGFENGWDQTKWPIYAQDCNQGGTVSLDSTQAHTGKNSIKVTSPGGYCGHIFFGNNNSIPTGSDLYVRTWLKATNALTSNHVSFITMTDASQGAGKHLRIGGQDQILMYNRETDDATLPDLSPQGTASSVPLPAGSWQCFEYHIGKDGTIETWLNGNAIPGLTAGPNANNPNSNGWGKTYKPSITGVYFGWESYGGDVNTFWYDDVAIGSTRQGCSGTGTGTGGSSTSSPSTTAAPPPPGTTTRPVTTTSKATTTAAPPPSTTTTLVTTTSAPAANCAAKYAQCGGQGWSGATCCQSGSTCKSSNQYYSQCL